MRSRQRNEQNGTVAGLGDAKAFGLRLLELRRWRGLTLREAAGLAGLSFSFWGQVERGEKEVNSRKTLEAMAGALRVHPSELTEHPWAPRDEAGTAANAGLRAMATALEDYELGADPGLPGRPWPQLAEDVQRLITTMVWTGDYAGQCELAPVLIGELHGAYLHLPQQRSEVLVGLMNAYSSVVWTSVRLGALGLPSLAARAVQQCAEILDDPVWLGYATRVRGSATGQLNRVAHYPRSVAAAESLSSQLDNGEALLACGLLHLDAALAAGAQADRDTAAVHLQEASALASRMDTEVGILADLGFGLTTVATCKTAIAMELREPGQALDAAKTARPELHPSVSHQAWFWANVGRALAAEKRTREKAVRVLVHAEQMAPQRIHNNLLVREVVADLLRQALSQAGRRELRALAWRMGLTPIRGTRPGAR
ncbi:MAG: helix-turn-helix domain-containing protein [Pseudonocardiaceae bacterium]